MQNRGYNIESKIINVLAVLSFLCLMNSFVLAKSIESKNTNAIYISISICLINTAIGSILVGNVWEKYYRLSTICYFVCELALALYICFIIFFLKSLFFKEISWKILCCGFIISHNKHCLCTWRFFFLCLEFPDRK